MAVAADQLVKARLTRTPVGELDSWCRPMDEDEAYTVQRYVHEGLTSAGIGEIVGRKVGCTTEVMQQYLNIPNPCAGGMFSSTIGHGDRRYRSEDFLRIGVECEIAIRLATDLVPDSAGNVSRDRAGAAVATCMAAIEVVEDRYANYRELGTPTLIADDFFNTGCVLGAEFTDFSPDALDSVTGRMEINGVEVGRGVGRDVLGHPLEPLCWLATASAARGEPLLAGEIVLLGSLVQTHWLEPGDTVRIANDPFGEVSMHLQ